MSQGRSVPAGGASGQNELQIKALTLSPRTLEAAQVEFGILGVTDLAENWCFSAAC